ncbi:MAG: hypothetical protein WDZ85_02445 [Candidatus Paceibacterota bacterium]
MNYFNGAFWKMTFGFTLIIAFGLVLLWFFIAFLDDREEAPTGPVEHLVSEDNR